jgi:hypothetical protein
LISSRSLESDAFIEEQVSRPALLLVVRSGRGRARHSGARARARARAGAWRSASPRLLRFTAHRPRPPNERCHRSRAGPAASDDLVRVLDAGHGRRLWKRVPAPDDFTGVQDRVSTARLFVPNHASVRGYVCAVLPRTAGVRALVVLLARCAGRSVITARVRLRRGWSLLRAARSRRRLSRTPCGARSRRMRCKRVRRPRSAALGR